MKKCLLILIILPLFSSFTRCIEKRNIAIGAGAALVIGMVYYYRSNQNGTQDKCAIQSNQTNETANNQENPYQENSTIIPSDEIKNELSLSRQETIRTLEQKINQFEQVNNDLRQSDSLPSTQLTNPQETFLKTFKASLEELEAYQKNQAH